MAGLLFSTVSLGTDEKFVIGNTMGSLLSEKSSSE